MQNGIFEIIIYNRLTRDLGQYLLRSIENYSDDPRVRQVLFEKADENFPLDVNNIPVGTMTATAA